MLNFILKISKNSLDLGGSKLILVFLLILFSTFVELLGISLIIPIISIFIDPTYIAEYKSLLSIKFLENSNFLNIVLILFFFIFLIKYALTIFFEYLIVKFTKKWEIDLIIRLIDYHLKRPWIEALRTKDSLIKNIITDIPTFIVQGVTGVLNIFKCGLILFGILLYLIYEKGLITIYLFLIFSMVFYFFLKTFKNYLSNVSKRYGNFMRIKFDLTSEINNGLREIKIYNLKNYFLKQYFTNESFIAKVDIVKKFIQILPKIGIELLCIIGFLLVITINSENPKNIIPFLGLLTFIIYRSQPLLTSLASLTAALQIHSVQINEGIEIIKKTKKMDSIEEKENSSDVNIKQNSLIEIKNLQFSYDEDLDKNKIFSDVNFKLEFGNIYGLSGKNGTGKSTLADLVIGLLKPQRGEINLDGKNIEQFSKSWTKSVAYLSQNYFLFNDSIKNNITLHSKKDDKFYKERYDRAIKISNLMEEINKFTDHDNMILKDSGSNLSGGQKQRIAIARLIYKDSKVVILDEPTASLDQISSTLMMKMLQEIKKDKLILVISHSKEILDKCDKVLSISNSKVNEI